MQLIIMFPFVKIFTEQQIGISAPNTSSGVTPKFPAVSTTSGKILRGSFKRVNAQSAHCIVNGSNIPVAEADDASITCLPTNNARWSADRTSNNYDK